MELPRVDHVQDAIRKQIRDFDIDLATFKHQPAEAGISLDALSEAFVRTLDRGESPYSPPVEKPEPGSSAVLGAPMPIPDLPYRPQVPDDTGQSLDPQRILEAILFVGNATNEPIQPAELARLMRGVRHPEIDAMIRELNARYEADGCPYQIVGEGAGFRLVLRPEFESLRDRCYNRHGQARLSKSAIEVLSIVAFHQPLAAVDVDKLRGRSSSGPLRQLVRRQLLSVTRESGQSRALIYRTTDRFLDFFGLQSLDELPQLAELDRR